MLTLRFNLLIKIVLGMILACGVMEIVMRWVFSYHIHLEPNYLSIYTPGTKTIHRLEGSGVAHWHEHGIRGIIQNDQEKTKILVLGDSLTEALQVSDRELYTFKAERLCDLHHVNISFINAGKSGRSIVDYILYAPRFKKIFNPSWVVIQMRTTDLTEDAWNPIKNHFERDLEKIKIIDKETYFGTQKIKIIKKLKTFFYNQSPFMLVLNFGRRVKIYYKAFQKEPPLFQASQIKKSEASFSLSQKAPEDYPLEKELDLLVNAYEGRLTLLLISPIQFKPPLLIPSKERTRILQYCIQKKMSCVEPAHSFEKLMKKWKSPYGFVNSAFNFGHLNSEGHEAVGQVLAEEIIRLKKNGIF